MASKRERPIWSGARCILAALLALALGCAAACRAAAQESENNEENSNAEQSVQQQSAQTTYQSGEGITTGATPDHAAPSTNQQQQQQVVNAIGTAALGSNISPDYCADVICVNLLAGAPFDGKELNPTFWDNLTQLCQVQTIRLVIADMRKIPENMHRAGFPGRDNLMWYSLARIYQGAWAPYPKGNDAEAVVINGMTDEIDAWWSSYISAVERVMWAAPETTAVIIINDAPDRLGYSLGNATKKHLSSLGKRVMIGNTIPGY